MLFHTRCVLFFILLRFRLGCRLGNSLGSRLGDRLSSRLGNRLGNRLGDRLSSRLGVRLSSRLGDRLGSRLGSSVLSYVSCQSSTGYLLSLLNLLLNISSLIGRLDRCSLKSSTDLVHALLIAASQGAELVSRGIRSSDYIATLRLLNGICDSISSCASRSSNFSVVSLCCSVDKVRDVAILYSVRHLADLRLQVLHYVIVSASNRGQSVSAIVQQIAKVEHGAELCISFERNGFCASN